MGRSGIEPSRRRRAIRGFVAGWWQRVRSSIYYRMLQRDLENRDAKDDPIGRCRPGNESEPWPPTGSLGSDLDFLKGRRDAWKMEVC